MLQEFKKFILRGNVVDLAVGVVIGSAFTAVVTALVADFFTPLIAAIGGKHDFSKLSFVLNNSTFNYGHFINALIAFISVAAVIFFLVVRPLNQLQTRAAKNKKPADPTEKKCPECLSTIPIKATRCAFCTAKLSLSKKA